MRSAATRSCAWRWVGTLASALVLAACGSAADGPEPAAEPSPSASASASAEGSEGVAEPALRDELVAMQRDDQAERTGAPSLPPGTKLPPTQDFTRTSRLQEIIAEHGWPTTDLVGEDGAAAAWLVAQHSDFDLEFQQEAVGLMRSAVAAGQADASDLAYLEDRVSVNLGEPQRYGSQVRCGADGTPAPATPLVDPEGVDVLRAEVGLGTLEDYYVELGLMCGEEAAQGAQPTP